MGELVCKQMLTFADWQMNSAAFADRQINSAADGYLVTVSDSPAEFFCHIINIKASGKLFAALCRTRGDSIPHPLDWGR